MSEDQDCLNPDDVDRELRITRYLILAMVAWTIVLTGLFAWGYIQVRSSTRATAEAEADAYLERDYATRKWSASHGGVYVPINERTQPNPHLAHLPHRDVITLSGQQLTLMNPAYMTRQMNESFSDLKGVQGKLTSLKPLRPQNKPDNWEREALLRLEHGESKVLDFTEIKGDPYLRMMHPMIVVEGCLKCHEHQGYQVGDIRGGTSIHVPMTQYLAQAHSMMSTQIISGSLIWLCGMGALFFGVRSIRKRINRRVDIERQLYENEVKFHHIYEHAPVMMHSVDESGVIRNVNQMWLKTTGHQRDEVIGRPIVDFVSAELMDYCKSVMIPRLWKEGHLNDEASQYVRNDGSIIDVRLNCRTATDQDGNRYSLSVIRDVTEHLAIQNELRLQSAALSTAASAVVITDREGLIVWVNEACRQMSGYSKEEVIGRTPRIFKSGQHSREVYAELWGAILNGENWQGELVNRNKNGSFYTEEMNISPVFDDEDNLTHFVAIKQDITDRIITRDELARFAADLVETRDELERQTSQLATQKEELEMANDAAMTAVKAKSEFLANMSHEIRTPMTAILGYTDLLLEPDQTVEDTKDCVETIRRNGEHLLTIINDILDLSKL